MIPGRSALGVLAALTLTGCAYSSSRLVAQRGVSTIAVAQFDNQTYRRDLEFRLTRAVAEEVRARTSWRLESPATADAILKGTIRSAETGVLAQTSNATPIAQRFSVVVDVELIERASGRVLRRFTTSTRQEYTPNMFGETLEGSATDTVTTALAEDVVEGLERPIGGDEAIPPQKAPRRTTPIR